MQWPLSWFTSPNFATIVILVFLGAIFSTLISGVLTSYYGQNWIHGISLLTALVCHIALCIFVCLKIDREVPSWPQFILLFWSYKMKIKRKNFFTSDILSEKLKEMKNWLLDNAQGKWYYSNKRTEFLFADKADAVAFKIMFMEDIDA